jgi:hypothetical protein
MGSNESIIYGTNHGHEYETVEDVPNAIDRDGHKMVAHYPNGMIVRSWPDLGHVAIGVQRYDEFGNAIHGTELDELIGSLWAELDRPGINRLIQGLRKHRDRVYGRDE